MDWLWINSVNNNVLNWFSFKVITAMKTCYFITYAAMKVSMPHLYHYLTWLKNSQCYFSSYFEKWLSKTLCCHFGFGVQEKNQGYLWKRWYFLFNADLRERHHPQNLLSFTTDYSCCSCHEDYSCSSFNVNYSIMCYV